MEEIIAKYHNFNSVVYKTIRLSRWSLLLRDIENFVSSNHGGTYVTVCNYPARRTLRGSMSPPRTTTSTSRIVRRAARTAADAPSQVCSSFLVWVRGRRPEWSLNIRELVSPEGTAVVWSRSTVSFRNRGASAIVRLFSRWKPHRVVDKVDTWCCPTFPTMNEFEIIYWFTLVSNLCHRLQNTHFGLLYNDSNYFPTFEINAGSLQCWSPAAISFEPLHSCQNVSISTEFFALLKI